MFPEFIACPPVPTTNAPGPSARQLPADGWGLVRDPLGALTQLAVRYGDIVRLPVPRHPVFVLSRPEHAEHVFVTEHENYVKSITYKPLRVFLGSGLITAEGDDYRRQRRLLQPLFTRRQVSNLAPRMGAAAARSSERMDRAAGTTIRLLPAMSELTLDTLGSTLFGVDLAPHGASLAKVVDAQLHVAARCVRNPLMLLWPEAGLRTTPGYRRWAAAAATLDGMVERMVADRRSGPTRGEAGDLLDVLLAGDERGSFSDQEIRDQLMTFFMAGHETTANALAWTFALLSTHPWARDQLEAEVDRVLDGGTPTSEQVDELVWTRAVLQEAMRLYPPVWTIERDARHDDEIDGVAVPAGSTVVVSPYLIQRNPAVWPNPEGFDPNRFLPHAGHDRHRLAFLAFGAGQRGCIGRSFALLETTIALASITQHYRFDLLPGTELRPEVGVTLRPAHGLPATLTKRSASRDLAAVG
jgi:cytochrome P450